MKEYPKHILNTILLFLLTITAAQSQNMHPGDVNNNGIVNGIDVLFWGIAFGSSGPERDDASTDFESQPITDFWSDDFPNGINYAYADGDGDGEIAEEDLTDAIEQNFGMTHGVIMPDVFSSQGNPTTDPFLSFDPDVPTATGGETVNVNISLGTMDIPATDFYGIAFTIDFDPARG